MRILGKVILSLTLPLKAKDSTRLVLVIEPAYDQQNSFQEISFLHSSDTEIFNEILINKATVKKD